jgi:pyruvate ferredoxin oxidoreductase gamma subunit
MFQVRFHGRGGQGVVTAAELLASAAFREDRHAQAFPSFGSERMGAPVMSFCRIDDKPIRTHEPVTEPDALIIQDPTLLHQADLFAGLGPGGYMLVNSARGFGELGMDEFVQGFHRDRLLVVPASSLAMTHLGRPLPGAALLGGFAALTWAVSLDSVLAAVNESSLGTSARP